jgi:hypothetical protein
MNLSKRNANKGGKGDEPLKIMDNLRQEVITLNTFQRAVEISLDG